ncbi:hypothetical protein OF83DRAFT_743025 [Amylostereum chailletii]|nr:hypothetical protein OF83DRAFT_743025 [Amylostereum chailletii]
MLRNVARLSLKRGIHTARPQNASVAANLTRHRLAMVLGGSVTAAAYFTWQLAAADNRIALDADPAPKKPATKVKKAAHPEPVFEAEPALDEPPSSHPVDAASAPEGTPGESGEGEGGGASQGAYDPVTGEINWDCPCLGGMAHGPCGEDFKAAFSCFIYSEAEPKGIDCVEKFKAMQDCFREHPEVYGEEILGDDEDEEVPAPAPDAEPVGAPIPAPAAASEIASTEAIPASTH